MTELNTGSNASNPVQKATKALRQAQVTGTKVKSGKSSHKSPYPTKPPPHTKSPVEQISDLHDTLPLGACVELTHLLLTAVPTLPFGAERSRVVLKIVVLFVTEYGSTA
jgi:hypothetical protein